MVIPLWDTEESSGCHGNCVPAPTHLVPPFTIPRGPSLFCQPWPLPVQSWSICLPPIPAHPVLSSSSRYPALGLPFPAGSAHFKPTELPGLGPLPHLPLPAPARPPVPVEVCQAVLPVGAGMSQMRNLNYSSYSFYIHWPLRDFFVNFHYYIFPWGLTYFT